jgi:hypothetical protein
MQILGEKRVIRSNARNADSPRVPDAGIVRDERRVDVDEVEIVPGQRSQGARKADLARTR